MKRPISEYNFCQRVDALTVRIEKLSQQLRVDALLASPSHKRVNTIRLRNLHRAVDDLAALFRRAII